MQMRWWATSQIDVPEGVKKLQRLPVFHMTGERNKVQGRVEEYHGKLAAARLSLWNLVHGM